MMQLAVASISVDLAKGISRLREAILTQSIFYTQPSLRPSANWRFDLRRVLLRADLVTTVAWTFWNQFAQQWPFQVCGLDLAAIPIITAITIEGLHRGHNVNGFVLRKERKSYGSGHIVEGSIESCPAICVDDLLNTGSSVERIARVLEENN